MPINRDDWDYYDRNIRKHQFDDEEEDNYEKDED